MNGEEYALASSDYLIKEVKFEAAVAPSYDDLLYGGAGDASIEGNTGNDVISGDDVADVLYGDSFDGSDVDPEAGTFTITPGSDGSIELVGVNAGDLENGHFIFGPEEMP